MEDVAGRGLECQKIMDEKNDGTNGSDKAVIPSCCLKALASAFELEDKCPSTIISGWFSGDYCIFFFAFMFYIFFYFLIIFLTRVLGSNRLTLLTLALLLPVTDNQTAKLPHFNKGLLGVFPTY